LKEEDGGGKRKRGRQGHARWKDEGDVWETQRQIRIRGGGIGSSKEDQERGPLNFNWGEKSSYFQESKDRGKRPYNQKSNQKD